MVQQTTVYSLHIQDKKHASPKIDPFRMMYSREPVTPWDLENDMVPLETEPEDLSLEETIDRMTNIHTQMLDIATSRKPKPIRPGHTTQNMPGILLKLVTNFGGRILSMQPSRKHQKLILGG